MIPYEILIRGDKDGKLSGSHCIDTPGADARPITPEDLADIAPAINAAAIAEIKLLEAAHAEALAAKDAEIASLNEYITRVGQVKQDIFSVIQNPDIDAETTTQTIVAIIAEGEKPEAERAAAEIEKQIAELQAKKAELLKSE